jgi:hypothetical protein
MLHSKQIEFSHPRTKQKMKIEAPMPEYFKEILEKLDKNE